MNKDKTMLKIILTKNNVRSLRRHDKVIKKVVFSRVKGKENKSITLIVDKRGDNFISYFVFKNNTTGVRVSDIQTTTFDKLPKTLEKEFDLGSTPKSMGKRFYSYVVEQIEMIEFIGGM